MAETDIDAMLEALQDLPYHAAVAWQARMLQGTTEGEYPALEANVTRVALAKLWQEMSETPELTE